MSIIYETSGRAREYFELAANLYGGCEHACVYCYGADVTRKDPNEFFNAAVPRKHIGVERFGATVSILAELERDAARLARKNETRHILLSFVTDPYQPAETEFRLTRRAITILRGHNLNVAILTKGGLRAVKDFDLLRNTDLFGVTLTFEDEAKRAIWEPNAASTSERIQSLSLAKARGILTWVSLEPVIDPAESLALIKATAGFTGHYKIGTLNYANKLPRELWDQVRSIDWRKFAFDAIDLLHSLGVTYYIKKDLARHIGQPEGIQEGTVVK